jgi:hypothetical protein
MAFGGKTRTSGQGRPKGAKNKSNQRREAEVAESGLTPLEYMLDLLRSDEASAEDRKWAAQNAAPYCHSKLSSVEASIKGAVDVRAKLLEMK